ncbi:MAG TPA: hypothetical protein LFW20_05245 [Rickettsia endosymbiont of Omalisus fontisbellaquei]|nr:hypothetical protein [Rickettsia endosymbiont of Omalisus fontisbellaquei]
MTTQNNLIPQSIFLLEPPYNSRSQELTAEIAAYCEKHELGTLETIEFTNPFDHESLRELVKFVAAQQSKPVMVIINGLSMHESINKILWAVLGTLEAAELIKVSTYSVTKHGIVLRSLNKEDHNFIAEATIFAERYGFDEWKRFESIHDRAEPSN